MPVVEVVMVCGTESGNEYKTRLIALSALDREAVFKADTRCREACCILNATEAWMFVAQVRNAY